VGWEADQSAGKQLGWTHFYIYTIEQVVFVLISSLHWWLTQLNSSLLKMVAEWLKE